MFKQIDFEKVIRANLIPNSNCHVYICEDTQTAFQLALKYGKYVRTHIIREKETREKVFGKCTCQMEVDVFSVQRIISYNLQ